MTQVFKVSVYFLPDRTNKRGQTKDWKVTVLRGRKATTTEYWTEKEAQGYADTLTGAKVIPAG